MKPFKCLLFWATALLLSPITNVYGSNTEPPLGVNKGLDTVYLPDNSVLNTQYLKPGLRQYLVYTTIPGVKRQHNMRLWQRRVSVAKRDNHKVFVTKQNWLSSDSARFEHFISVNNYTDFLPLYHSQQSHRGVVAYNWYSDHIQAADSVTGNQKKGLILAFDQPNLNWNLDLETFEMLPMDQHKIFAINFYDAGIETPQRLVYKVTGEDSISVYGSAAKVRCWKLFMEASYKGMKFTETFWISQDSHELLMEKDDLGHGAFRYKIKLPDFAAATL
ncbi:DUF3108 domain-containing protein [Arachidicoccus terrestris]|uniref:DUF3108 domain-containing protein n=1 Tax=Arachidicoccus terrestris TaxID=2875539 RepID=UPI001CC7291A|nr:hypothetical protein [Arachidicoccus terrestris]UAY56583.1 hypothetical protein K9M52_06155 [Arachidicoccus terrestris]